MPTFRDFQLVRAQAVVFTPELLFHTRDVLSYLLDKWGDTFTGEPVTFPSVEGMPPQFPRLTWASADSKFRLQVSPARVDLVWEPQEPHTILDLKEALRLAVELFKGYLRATRNRASRLACVVTRVAADQTPAMTLARHFCKQEWLNGPLNRPSEFELHAHKRFPLSGKLEINSWVRCKTGFLENNQTATPANAPVILVEQDFNTLPEEADERKFTPQEITAFYELAPSEFEKVLSLYFPG